MGVGIGLTTLVTTNAFQELSVARLLVALPSGVALGILVWKLDFSEFTADPAEEALIERITDGDDEAFTELGQLAEARSTRLRLAAATSRRAAATYAQSIQDQIEGIESLLTKRPGLLPDPERSGAVAELERLRKELAWAHSKAARQ